MKVVTVRRATIAAGIAAPLALLGMGSRAGVGQVPNLEGKTAAQAFKNIKVLKTLPANQLIPVMHKINDSLGVGCDFCHVIETGPNGRHTGFEKDTKPTKNIARQMVVMTNKINSTQKVLDKKATCFMCHHGHAMPEITPPASAAPTPAK